MNGEFRADAALEIAKALIMAGHYKDNAVFQKSMGDYIAEDAVDITDSLMSRLAIQPEHEPNATPSNICTIEFPKAR